MLRGWTVWSWRGLLGRLAAAELCCCSIPTKGDPLVKVQVCNYSFQCILTCCFTASLPTHRPCRKVIVKKEADEMSDRKEHLRVSLIIARKSFTESTALSRPCPSESSGKTKVQTCGAEVDCSEWPVVPDAPVLISLFHGALLPRLPSLESKHICLST